ncbi:MAG TPA: two-component system response regulator [Ruminococcaceae bacterium]|nr:two-component system response regulator [Oscillospiraceae bacterium]HBN80026.1 two-component system response regulator [Oscillospiraceae bacterium]
MDRVLIVDDNKLAVEIVDDLLTTWGYRTKICGNGSEAFRCALEFKPDVILLDIMLPGMNGFAICSKLKTDPATQRIPIIILTVLDNVEDRINALNMGADAFLSKPVKYQELRNRVEWAIRYKNSLDSMEPREMVAESYLKIMRGKSSRLYRHSVNVSRYCERVGKILYVMDENLSRLVTGACLHDVGRIVTDDPAGHISAGLDIVSALNMHPWLEPYIRSHHEKMNGEGFPDGLKAEQLPLNIRILTEVNRFVELMEEDEESAVRKLGDECGKQYWSTEVFKALKLVLKDDDFKKKLSLTAER